MFAVESGVGQHIVFCGEPAAAYFLVLHPAWHILLDGGGADDACVSKGHEHGASGVGRDAGLEGDGAELIVVSAVGSGHGGSLKFEV